MKTDIRFTHQALVEKCKTGHSSSQYQLYELYVDAMFNIGMRMLDSKEDADLSGSSEVIDYDLSVEDLKIEMSGASDAAMSIAKSIDIRASGASSLSFKGDAKITYKNLSGASEIIKID